MTEAIIILMNMRGGCATVGDKVHALFRVNGRARRAIAAEETEHPKMPSRTVSAASTEFT